MGKRRIARPSVMLTLLMALAATAEAASARSEVAAADLIEGAPAGESAPIRAALRAAGTGDDAALLRGKLAAQQLDESRALSALERVANSPTADPHTRAVALITEGDLEFALGNYAAATRSLSAWRKTAGPHPATDELRSVRQTLAVAQCLQGQPRQRIARGTARSVETVRDKANLLRTAVQLNASSLDAVLDTGANLSVVSTSVAKAIGLKVICTNIDVQSSSTTNLVTRVGLAERLQIAGLEFRNVAFLVLDDDKLTFPVPGGYSIGTILGFPVFRELRRFTFTRDGRLIPGQSIASAARANLHIDGNDLFVDASVNGIDMSLHLDTGAADTILTTRFAQAHREQLPGVEGASGRTVGAGANAVANRTARLDRASMRIAGESVVLPSLSVTLASDDERLERKTGILGVDVLSSFPSYSLDFDTMTFAVEPARNATVPAPPRQ